jgi:hypothetical protein
MAGSLRFLHISSTVASGTPSSEGDEVVNIEKSTVDHFHIFTHHAAIAIPTKAHLTCNFSLIHIRMSAIQPRDSMGTTFYCTCVGSRDARSRQLSSSRTTKPVPSWNTCVTTIWTTNVLYVSILVVKQCVTLAFLRRC